MSRRFTGLVAATHTPFKADGALNLSVIEKQAAHLAANNVGTALARIGRDIRASIRELFEPDKDDP